MLRLKNAEAIDQSLYRKSLSNGQLTGLDLYRSLHILVGFNTYWTLCISHQSTYSLLVFVYIKPIHRIMYIEPIYLLCIRHTIQGKPTGSASVLVKVSLNICDAVWEYIGDHFATTEEEACKCFTRAALGAGTLWNKRNAGPELQRWWMNTIWVVSTQNLGIAFKGSAAGEYYRCMSFYSCSLVVLSHWFAT